MLKYLLTTTLLFSCGLQPRSQTKDAVTVGQNGEVILFYKKGDSIHKKKCEDHTFIEARTDCVGTEAVYSLESFKKALHDKLSPNNFLGLDPQYREYVKNYSVAINSGERTAAELTTLKNQLAEIQKRIDPIQIEIKKIEDFIATFGLGDTEKLAKLKTELATIQQETTTLNPNIERLTASLSFMYESKIKMQELLNKLLDDLLGSEKIHFLLTNGKPEEQFFFQLLENTVGTSISPSTNRKKVLSLASNNGSGTVCALISENNRKRVHCWGNMDYRGYRNYNAINTYNFQDFKGLIVTYFGQPCIADNDKILCFESDKDKLIKLHEHTAKIDGAFAAYAYGFCYQTQKNVSELTCTDNFRNTNYIKKNFHQIFTTSTDGANFCSVHPSNNTTVCSNQSGDQQYSSQSLAKLIASTSDGDFSCLIDHKSKIECFGDQQQLQDFELNNIPSLISPTSISMSFGHACVIDQKQVKCWGAQSSINNAPKQVQNPRSLVSSNSNACVIHDQGVSCWGRDNEYEYSPLNVPAELQNFDNTL